MRESSATILRIPVCNTTATWYLARPEMQLTMPSAHCHLQYHAIVTIRTGTVQAGPLDQPPMSMSSWNRPDNVCFHEVAKVHMLNGGRKFARDVHRGDILEGGGRVRCVVITTGYADLVRLRGLLIAMASCEACQWVFPVQAGSLIRTPCEAVPSLSKKMEENGPTLRVCLWMELSVLPWLMAFKTRLQSAMTFSVIFE